MKITFNYSKPRLLETQAAVDEANAYEIATNSGRRWRLGDHCYLFFS